MSLARMRQRRNGKWILQEKRAPGLAGGIWRKVSDEYPTIHEARIELLARLCVV